jgi:hypothetical protein
LREKGVTGTSVIVCRLREKGVTSTSVIACRLRENGVTGTSVTGDAVHPSRRPFFRAVTSGSLSVVSDVRFCLGQSRVQRVELAAQDRDCLSHEQAVS